MPRGIFRYEAPFNEEECITRSKRALNDAFDYATRDAFRESLDNADDVACGDESRYTFPESFEYWDQRLHRPSRLC